MKLKDLPPEFQRQAKQQLSAVEIETPKSDAARKWKQSWHTVGGVRKFFRSSWECNYARYLEWLRQQGQITSWEHEPKTFWFEGIKRGVASYLPDFRVQQGDLVYYVEVKGWMDRRSKTKIKRMAKYYPDVELRVVDAKIYKALTKQVSAFIPDWDKIDETDNHDGSDP